MRRRDLLARITKAAAERDLKLDQVREGASHTIFRVGSAQFSMPRHSEINEMTARSIMKYLETELGQGWWR
jgi:mRNA interferase HicA